MAVADSRPHPPRRVPRPRHHARHHHALLRAHGRTAVRLRQPHTPCTNRLSKHGIPAPQRRKHVANSHRPRNPPRRLLRPTRRTHLRLDSLSATLGLFARRPRPGRRNGSLARRYRSLRRRLHSLRHQHPHHHRQAATVPHSSGCISSGSSDTPRSTSPSSPAWASPPWCSPTSPVAASSPTAS